MLPRPGPGAGLGPARRGHTAPHTATLATTAQRQLQTQNAIGGGIFILGFLSEVQTVGGLQLK